MDHRHHSSTTDARRKPLQQTTLKDTCDMCSASKVKCDKQKPICGRCERLEYPCFFSPARRVRKHRYNPGLSSKKGRRAVAEPSTEPESLSASRDGSITANSPASDEMVDPSLRSGREGTISTEFAESYPASLPGDSGMVLPEASGHDSSSSGVLLPDRRGPSSQSDCTAHAISVLQQINLVICENLTTRSPLDQGSPLSLDGLIETASMAIKHVSAMLICPCSARIDTGLMAATVCTAILDIYEMILQQSKPSEQLSPSTKRLSRCQHDENSSTMRLLGELPKAAKLMTQFTKRYSQENEGSLKELPGELATSVTTRLRSLIDEVTNWVIRV